MLFPHFPPTFFLFVFSSEDDSLLPRNPNRKTKTFSEILNEKAKSGGRIGYNLQQYVEPNGDIVEGNRNETNQGNNGLWKGDWEGGGLTLKHLSLPFKLRLSGPLVQPIQT